MTAPIHLELESFVPYRITLLASHIAVAFAKQHAQKFGLSIPEWRIIATLGRYECLPSGAVTEKTGMDKAKVSRAVTRLVAARLLQREENSDDLRSNYLRLTDSGREIHDQIVPIALGLEAKLLDALTKQEIEIFTEVLAKLDKQVEELWGKEHYGDAHI